MLTLCVHFMSTEEEKKKSDLIAVHCSSLKYQIIIPQPPPLSTPLRNSTSHALNHARPHRDSAVSFFCCVARVHESHICHRLMKTNAV